MPLRSGGVWLQRFNVNRFILWLDLSNVSWKAHNFRIFEHLWCNAKASANACINLMFTLSSGSNACIALRSVVAADIKYSCLWNKYLLFSTKQRGLHWVWGGWMVVSDSVWGDFAQGIQIMLLPILITTSVLQWHFGYAVIQQSRSAKVCLGERWDNEWKAMFLMLLGFYNHQTCTGREYCAIAKPPHSV